MSHLKFSFHMGNLSNEHHANLAADKLFGKMSNKIFHNQIITADNNPQQFTEGQRLAQNTFGKGSSFIDNLGPRFQKQHNQQIQFLASKGSFSKQVHRIQNIIQNNTPQSTYSPSGSSIGSLEKSVISKISAISPIIYIGGAILLLYYFFK